MKPCLKSESPANARILAVCCWLGVAAAQAQPTNLSTTVSLAEVGQTMAQVNTVFTHFVQERHLSLFDKPLRSEGYLCFAKPGRLRWEITKPYRSILISDGAGVAQYEWVDERWKKLDLGMADALQHIVAQIAAVMEGRYAQDQREYSVSLSRGQTGPVVTLVPEREMIRKVMKSIEVYLAPDLQATRRVVLRENDGDFTEIQFSEQMANVTYPQQTFDRTAPLDLAVIRETVLQTRPRP
jgi:outer membrane lipoprotein-sorting protein